MLSHPVLLLMLLILCHILLQEKGEKLENIGWDLYFSPLLAATKLAFQY